VFWVLVAVMVTPPPLAGAVNRPFELIVPALALQVTDEVALPRTCALHCEVCPESTVEGVQPTLMEELLEDGVEVATWLPAHPLTAASRHKRNAGTGFLMLNRLCITESTSVPEIDFVKMACFYEPESSPGVASLDYRAAIGGAGGASRRSDSEADRLRAKELCAHD
jgi:hypothetical protein